MLALFLPACSLLTDTGDLDGTGGGAGVGGYGSPVVLASAQGSPRTITVDGTTAYWVDDGSGAVRAVAKEGGAVRIIGGGAPNVRALAVDSANVYWVEAAPTCGIGEPFALKRQRKSGGTPDALLQCDYDLGTVHDMASDGAFLYFTAKLGVFFIPTDGGAASRIGDEARNVGAVSVNASAVYWYDGDKKQVVAYEKSSQTVHPLAVDEVGVKATAADDGAVYWTTPGALKKVSLAKGTTETVIGGENGAAAVAIFGTTLFWTAPSAGKVLSVPTAGGSATAITSGQTGPESVVVDGSGVYFTTDAGDVVRLPAH